MLGTLCSARFSTLLLQLHMEGTGGPDPEWGGTCPLSCETLPTPLSYATEYGRKSMTPKHKPKVKDRRMFSVL